MAVLIFNKRVSCSNLFSHYKNHCSANVSTCSSSSNNNNTNNSSSDNNRNSVKTFNNRSNKSHLLAVAAGTGANALQQQIQTQQNHPKQRQRQQHPQTQSIQLRLKQQQQLLFVIFVLLLGHNALTTIQGAAIYSNDLQPNFEPLCSTQQEHFIQSDGKESSLILEFNGDNLEQTTSCTRILSAPHNYGFIVRMILPKIRHRTALQTAAFNTNTPTSFETPTTPATASTTSSSSLSPNASASALSSSTIRNSNSVIVANTTSSAFSDVSSLLSALNSTAIKNVLARTCPLSIFSAQDPHAALWRMDPCLLEDTAPEMEDPVRLFHGRIRIVWDHGHNTLNSKLMVTALGKGQQCHSEDKHQCLKIGDEPILCISKDLVCDGIRHCPYSNEYDSDEDYGMCWKRRRFGEPIPPTMETDIFEHFALEVFRNLFAFDVTRSNRTVNGTLLKSNVLTTTEDGNAENTTEHLFGHHHRRNSTRFGVNSDLSKYGPWGYLMLGMLLCGGALLICGLWASASQHAANNERESALQSAQYANAMEQQASTNSPPNYDELDPPPAYSVLFPHQKTNSSLTINSLGVASSTMTSLMPAVMAASSRVAVSAAIPPTATLTTEQDAAGSSNSNAVTATTPAAAPNESNI